jgi:hypothetical protein
MLVAVGIDSRCPNLSSARENVLQAMFNDFSWFNDLRLEDHP